MRKLKKRTLHIAMIFISFLSSLEKKNKIKKEGDLPKKKKPTKNGNHNRGPQKFLILEKDLPSKSPFFSHFAPNWLMSTKTLFPKLIEERKKEKNRKRRKRAGAHSSSSRDKNS